MSKYNVKREPIVKKTITHQGGVGFTQKPESELIGILSTGIQNTYYEKETERGIRLRELIDKIAKKNKEFVAKALVYARSVFGQRSVTHLGAVDLMPHLQGDPLGKRFFSKRNKKEKIGGIIYRIDDMMEILACYMAKNKIESGDKWTMPKAMKVGFKNAIENADTYELAKYQMKNNIVSLVDIVNLVHPFETKKNGFINVPLSEYTKAIKGTKWEKEEIPMGNEIKVSTLRALVLGILKQFNTVEDKNTETGKVVAELVKEGEVTKDEAEKILVEKKTENYSELIKTKKIGYLALLRNLRNILKTDNTELLNEACLLLVNKDFIRRSLVFPHQIDLALEILIIEFSGRQLQKVTKALSEAYELSIPNLEQLLPEGKTAVVFDTSGSMEGHWSGNVSISYNGKKHNINSKPCEKAALIAATFAKGTCGDVYHFGTSCAKITGWNANDSINTLKREFQSHNGECGHGTYYENILPKLEESGGYTRIIIITDEQNGGESMERTMKEYSNKYGSPYIYVINIVGYGPTVVKTNNRVFRMYGYTQSIYEAIPKLEINVNQVIDEINKIII